MAYFSVSFHTSARAWRCCSGVRPSTREVEFWRTTWVWVKPLRLYPSSSNLRRYSKNPKKTTTTRRKSQRGVQTGSGRVTNEIFAVRFFTTVKVGLVEPWIEHKEQTWRVRWKEQKTMLPSALLRMPRGQISENEKANYTWPYLNWLNRKGDSKIIKSRGTLVVCPASLIGHWEQEAKTRLKTGIFNLLHLFEGTHSKQICTTPFRSLVFHDLEFRVQNFFLLVPQVPSRSWSTMVRVGRSIQRGSWPSTTWSSPLTAPSHPKSRRAWPKTSWLGKARPKWTTSR